MRIGLFVVAVAFGLGAPAADKDTITFAKSDLGKVPAGWTTAKTGTGDGSVWKVVEDTSTPSKTGFALAQTAVGPNALFNLCVRDEPVPANVQVSVRFKSIEGEKDQGGGVVWRYQDAKNYYTCRFNPLEGNFRLYHFVDGKRTQLASVEDVKLAAGEWHTITARMFGDSIRCVLDGGNELAVKDTTIAKAGKVGLWTKADARTRFDEFRVTPATEK